MLKLQARQHIPESWADSGKPFMIGHGSLCSMEGQPDHHVQQSTNKSMVRDQDA